MALGDRAGKRIAAKTSCAALHLGTGSPLADDDATCVTATGNQTANLASSTKYALNSARNHFILA